MHVPRTIRLPSDVLEYLCITAPEKLRISNAPGRRDLDAEKSAALPARRLARPRVLRSHVPGVQPGYRWLRFDVPPLAGLLRVPALPRPWTAFVDAEQTPPGAEIGCRGKRVVILRLAATEILDRPFAFAAVDAQLPLGTWSRPGLQHFSGLMTYEKVVDTAASLLRERLLLDCGQVGVAAEAWINGKPVGSRPWAPYVFDVTEAIHAGRNVLKVRIANTAGNARAVGPSLANLRNIDVDGWHGPARLVPLVDRDIECRLV